MTKKNIVDKEESVELVKIAGEDEFYLYPDGIHVPCRRVDELVWSSKFTDAEKEALEEATGKDFRRIQADHLHKQMAEKKAKSDAISERIRERREAEDRALLQRGKDLFNAGYLIVLKDGTQIKDLLPFDDDDFRKIATVHMKRCSWLLNTFDEYQGALVLEFISNKYPGYLAFVTAVHPSKIL